MNVGVLCPNYKHIKYKFTFRNVGVLCPNYKLIKYKFTFREWYLHNPKCGV